MQAGFNRQQGNTEAKGENMMTDSLNPKPGPSCLWDSSEPHHRHSEEGDAGPQNHRSLFFSDAER